jgi:hypothetical protein
LDIYIGILLGAHHILHISRIRVKITGQVSAMSILGPGENSSGKKGTEDQKDPRVTLGWFGKENMLYPAGNQAPVPRPSISQYQSLQ